MSDPTILLSAKPYLYADELAALTPWTVEAIRKKVQRGDLRLGEHYFQEGHRARLIFKWGAIVRLIEGGTVKNQDGGETERPREVRGQAIDVDEATTGLHRLLGRRA